MTENDEQRIRKLTRIGATHFKRQPNEVEDNKIEHTEHTQQTKIETTPTKLKTSKAREREREADSETQKQKIEKKYSRYARSCSYQLIEDGLQH